MKKILTTILSLVTLVALAQAPQNISYQAIARQVSGAVLPNQPIGVEFKIYQTSTSGTLVYSETHNATTNGFGLFSLFIGGGTPSSGTFSAINWSTGNYWVETSIDPTGGTSFTSVGAQQLMSVPYALYAETSGNSSATPTININAPNMVSSPSSGIYNISVPSYSAGAGISIASGIISNTGSSSSSTITGSGLAIVTPSVGNNFTINVPAQTLSVGSGSLSISGGNSIALPASQVLSISANTLTLSGGGGAITLPPQTLSLSGNTLTSGVASNSVNLSTLSNLWTVSGSTLYPTSATQIGIGTTTPNNLFQVAGLINFESNGSNTSLGTNTGSGTSPNNIYNTFVGYYAGQAVGTSTTGGNTYVGYKAGVTSLNGSTNSFFGYQSGITNTAGISNTFMGANSGANNITGSSNTFIGYGADLFSTTQLTNATAIGYNAKVDTNNALVLGGSGVNVGIGTTKPEASFHVTNSTGSQIKFGHNNQSKIEWFFNVDGLSHLGLRNENYGTTLNVMDFNTITGNVGIGVISPAQKLDVAGNIQIPAINDYIYASPKTDYYSVSALSLNTEGTYSRANLAGGVYISNGTAGTQGNLYSGINLPNGAVVTGVDAYVLDNDGIIGHDISYIQLWRQDGAVGSSYGNAINMAQTPGTSFTSSLIVKLSTTAISNAIIDNSNYTYYLRVGSVQSAPNLMVFKIVITYSVTKTN